MSADNGIYIGKFPKALGGFEYRVVEAQAIDNLYCCSNQKEEDARIFRTFHDGEVFMEEGLAWVYANKYSKEFCVLEYGLNMLEFKRPFPHEMTLEKSEKIIWGKRGKL